MGVMTDKLQEIKEALEAIIHQEGELNPNNYTEVEVERLNSAFIGDFQLAKQALNALNSYIEERSRRETELLATIAELEGMLDMRSKADNRAVKTWWKNTGRNLTIPDHADLCVYLLEVIAKLRESLIEIINISDRKHDAWDKAKQALEKTKDIK